MPHPAPCRDWVNRAIARIEADYQRSADSHLIRLDLPALPGIPLYLKDESCHPTGSLKHRLARSLFLYALCNGWIREGMPIIEASSGSTAISEAYFARLIGVPFIAVMARCTSPEKIAQIEAYGGRCHLTDATGDIYGAAEALAAETGGHYMDQFTYAERATDWRGNNNIAESIYTQMAREEHPIPRWIVVAAGTGGTSATIGRYIRYDGRDRRSGGHCTELCVVDPENSVFMDFWRDGDASRRLACGGRIEGIGRPRVEPSFLRSVVDHMIRVPDAASIAAMRALEGLLGRRAGPSTGTNLVGAFALMAQMKARGERGSVVTLLCDGGERYRASAYSPEWIAAQGLDVAPHAARIERFLADGTWTP